MPLAIVSRSIHVPSPKPGTRVTAPSFYVANDGVDLLRYISYASRSDTIDVTLVERSADNGRTWAADHTIECEYPAPDGKGRRHPRGGYVDPKTGRYLTFRSQGVLPTDHPLEGMRRWTLFYGVYEDGGRRLLHDEQIIQSGLRPDGTPYTAENPIPGVHIGHNCMMSGDYSEQAMTRRDGVILFPIQSTPLGPDGDYVNPGKGMTYTDCLVMHGRWQADGRLAWTASDRVVGDPARTTRGLIEPTLAELNDGTMIMVMRGSNDAAKDLPGYRWIARSADGGMTWSKAEPWTATDKVPFHSPSSCSQLMRHSSGRLYWIGNLCDRNPHGNYPRYPLIAAEVDLETGLLKRNTMATIDDRMHGDSSRMTLSNFYAREDRETGDVLVFGDRLFATGSDSGALDWTSDSLIYRLRQHG